MLLSRDTEQWQLQLPVSHTTMGLKTDPLYYTVLLKYDVLKVKCVKCIFNLQYFQFVTGLSGHNPMLFDWVF
jgi:hypothetical protein